MSTNAISAGRVHFDCVIAMIASLILDCIFITLPFALFVVVLCCVDCDLIVNVKGWF